MTEKTASVHWEGQGKKGQGQISTETAAIKAYPYGFGSRFGDDRSGTNPEELLAAAHAACFTMAFSFACDKAGFATDKVDTTASVRLAADGDGFVIDRIALTLTADIPGIDEATFQDIAKGAKAACPLSKALASVPEITMTATLNPATAPAAASPEAPAASPTAAPADPPAEAPARAPAGQIPKAASGLKTSFLFEVQYLATSQASQDSQDGTMKKLDSLLQALLANQDKAAKVLVSDSHKGSSNKIVELVTTLGDADIARVLETFAAEHGVSISAIE